MNLKKEYCRVAICVHPLSKKRDGNYGTNHYHKHWLKEYRYPRSIIERRRWFFTYVGAKMQVRFPRNYISIYFAYYENETKEYLNSKRRQKISAAKAQITKVQNVINLYVVQKKGELFFDEATDPVLLKLKVKLEQKREILISAKNENITESIN